VSINTELVLARAAFICFVNTVEPQYNEEKMISLPFRGKNLSIANYKE
jgi:hypothetical protein